MRFSTCDFVHFTFTKVDINTHPFTHSHLTALFPGLPGWAGTRKAKTNLDFTEARDCEWQWHQPGRMQICTLIQTDNHASTSPLSFLQAGCPSCRPTNSVKALKATWKEAKCTENVVSLDWLQVAPDRHITTVVNKDQCRQTRSDMT